MQEKHKDIAVLAVGVRNEETPAMLKSFASAQGLKHSLLVGGNSVAGDYGVRATPTTFAINAQGVIVDNWLGMDTARLEAAAARLAAK